MTGLMAQYDPLSTRVSEATCRRLGCITCVRIRWSAPASTRSSLICASGGPKRFSLKFAERVLWLRLMKEIFAEDTLGLKLSAGRIWEVRYQLFDQIALRMIDSSNLFLQMDIDELLHLDFAPSVQVVTDRNEAYVHDRLDRKRMIDQIAQAIASRGRTPPCSPLPIQPSGPLSECTLRCLKDSISARRWRSSLCCCCAKFTERLEIPLHIAEEVAVKLLLLLR